MDSVETVVIQNCPLVDQYEVIKHFVNQKLTISVDNLQSTEETALTSDFMNWLYDINAELKGSIYVRSISDDNLNIYREKWLELEVNLKQIYAKDVIFGITGEGGLDE